MTLFICLSSDAINYDGAKVFLTEKTAKMYCEEQEPIWAREWHYVTGEFVEKPVEQTKADTWGDDMWKRKAEERG